MGLATIDPHSHKVQTNFHKIPKFSVNRPNSKQDRAIWKCQNLQRNVIGYPDKHPDSHTFQCHEVALKEINISNEDVLRYISW